MRKIIIALFFISFSICFSQERASGLVIYKKTIKFPKPKKKSSYYDKELKSIIKSLDKLKYILKFNDTASFFYLEKGMNLDIESIHRRAFDGKGKSEFYTNIKTHNSIETINFAGKDFKINNSSPDFKLSKETKIIGNYECYKATAVETINFSKINPNMKDQVNEIIAWYTTKIPSQFGPLNYHGLPGLILELQYSNVTYTASHISFDEKPINIKSPTKGKEVTYEEFQELVMNAIKQLN